MTAFRVELSGQVHWVLTDYMLYAGRPRAPAVSSEGGDGWIGVVSRRSFGHGHVSHVKHCAFFVTFVI